MATITEITNIINKAKAGQYVTIRVGDNKTHVVSLDTSKFGAVDSEAWTEGWAGPSAEGNDDNVVYATEPMNEHWTWTSDDPNCPESFLKKANTYDESKPVFVDETYWLLFGLADHNTVNQTVVGNLIDTSVAFEFIDEERALTFNAVATRASATDTTPVRCHPRDDGTYVTIS